MKSVTSLLLLLLLSFINNHAQESTAIVYPVQPGHISVSISIERFSLMTNWSSIMDATFTAKYHRDEKQAFRLLLLYKKTKSHEEQIKVFDRFSQIIFPAKGYAQFSIEYLQYPRITDNVIFFLAAGPSLLVSYRNDGEKHQYFEHSTYGFGASGAIGMEYFVRANLSLMAEFALSFHFNMKYYNEYFIYDSNNLPLASGYYSLKSTYLEPFVRFGMSFYF